MIHFTTIVATFRNWFPPFLRLTTHTGYRDLGDLDVHLPRSPPFFGYAVARIWENIIDIWYLFVQWIERISFLLLLGSAGCGRLRPVAWRYRHADFGTFIWSFRSGSVLLVTGVFGPYPWQHANRSWSSASILSNVLKSDHCSRCFVGVISCKCYKIARSCTASEHGQAQEVLTPDDTVDHTLSISCLAQLRALLPNVSPGCDRTDATLRIPGESLQRRRGTNIWYQKIFCPATRTQRHMPTGREKTISNMPQEARKTPGSHNDWCFEACHRGVAHLRVSSGTCSQRHSDKKSMANCGEYDHQILLYSTVFVF